MDSVKRSNPYQARAVNREETIRKEILHFPLTSAFAKASAGRAAGRSRNLRQSTQRLQIEGGSRFANPCGPDVRVQPERRLKAGIRQGRAAFLEGIVAGGDVLGELVELLFEGGDLGVEMADHGQVVLEGDLSQGMVFGRQQAFLPGIAVAAGLGADGAVVSQLMGVNPSEQFGATPDIKGALAQESS